jgi:hypothetical protein
MGRARQWQVTVTTLGAVALGLGSVAFVALAGEDGEAGSASGTVGTVVGTMPDATETPAPVDTGNFKGRIGDFEVQGSDLYELHLPCDLPRAASEAELRESELWFERVIGIETELPHHAVCDGEVMYVSGDAWPSVRPDTYFYGGDFYYFGDAVNLPFDNTRENFVELSMAGMPALGSVEGEECRLSVIERRPTNERPGIFWEFSGAFRSTGAEPLDCQETALLAEEVLAEWGGSAGVLATTPMEAVERAVEESGREFAGHCETVTVFLPGPVCAWEHGTSGEQLAFGVSPVEQAWWASELYFVVRDGDGWLVDHVEPGPCRNQVPCPPPPGATVEIVTDEADSCANVRREPGINGELVDCLANGTLALVSDWPVDMDARTWVPLTDLGWVSASYLRCVGNCEPPEGEFYCGL